MKKIVFPPRSEWEPLFQRAGQDYKNVHEVVAPILADVKARGDEALRAYGEKFDQVSIDTFAVSASEIEAATREVPEELKEAIQLAKRNIEQFHASQQESEKEVETMPGVVCWRKSVAIEKVGLYIPGQKAPLFSTLLMLGVPALMAGCQEIIICTPPRADASIHPVVLYTAHLLGISKIFKVGGAQAVAAMSYGTESIPAVYKIFGPSNQYVTAAKQLVSEEGIGIDLPAGPSEVLVIADDSASPEFVAADLLSQAEHGEDSQVILLSDSAHFVDQVLMEVQAQLMQLPRKEIAEGALSKSRALVLKDMEEALEFSNQYAPEHLIISTRNDEEMAAGVTNAGSVFLGPYSPESVGDYASGTNHTLPTEGFARVFSGVSLDSFVKKITFQRLSQEGIVNIGQAVELMAAAEGLEGHKNAVTVRLAQIKSGN